MACGRGRVDRLAGQRRRDKSGPDQAAGGNPLQFTGLGDAGINRSYGWGWGKGRQAEILFTEMRDFLNGYGIPDDLLGDVRMNVNIRVLIVRP